MVQSKRGRGRGRAGPGPRVLPPIRQHLQSEAACWTLRDEREVESDDSTQPPDIVCETFLETTSAEVNTASEVPNISKRGRGVTKGMEFERLRKYGKIPLEIKDSKIGPSCNNTTVYTMRVTWIVKHYTEIRHVSWSVVDVKDKDELIDCVQKDRNLIDFYKDAHWSIKKGRFVTPTTEENYNKMVSMMNAKEVECRTDEAAAVIFREVLGHRSSYSRGLGHSVLPEKSIVAGVPNEEYERLTEENQQNRKNAEYYQNRVIKIEGGFAAMRNHMLEHEQLLNLRMSKLETELESQRETLNADP
ncbi:hypothetical protein F2P56_022834 [Juglans regia]|uniref:Uncharacterized protein n=1 Tax=Juglans regia TaxID=51240 RepID=A0A833URE1_JUGRE|nr:hypothetical protein F2P56_022834 [Juglans regia]